VYGSLLAAWGRHVGLDIVAQARRGGSHQFGLPTVFPGE